MFKVKFKVPTPEDFWVATDMPDIGIVEMKMVPRIGDAVSVSGWPTMRVDAVIWTLIPGEPQDAQVLLKW